MNPILSLLTQENDISKVVDSIKSAPDPNAMIQNMAMTNPQVKQAMDIVKQYGDPKTAFYAIAKQKGIDPQSILKQLNL